MVKNICLIWPAIEIRNKYPLHFPLWALSLSAYLKERIPNINIHILDQQIYKKQTIINKMNKIKPEIVGISPSYRLYKDSLYFARKAKKNGSKVVLGGSFASSMKREILKNRGFFSNDYCVDAIIQRDGEDSFFKYIQGIDLDKINNLVCQGRDKEIIENKIKLINLNLLPLPDFNMLNINRYFKLSNNENKKFTNIYFSKGCSWRDRTGGCIFCSSLEKEVRRKDPEKAAKELYYLYKNFYPDVKIHDEDFLSDIDWINDFLKSYRSLSKRFPSLYISARADKIKKDIIEILKKMNVRNISIGFETGSKENLNKIKKGINLSYFKKSVNLLDEAKISVTGNFIYGVPNEDKKSLNNTFSLIKELTSFYFFNNIRCQRFVPLPSSASWTMFLDKINDDKYQGLDLINWSEVKDEWMKHFCSLKKSDIDNFINKLDNLSRKNRFNLRFIS